MIVWILGIWEWSSRAAEEVTLKRSRTELFDGEEAFRRIEEEGSDAEGISSDEESDLDRQFYNVYQELRYSFAHRCKYLCRF